jgi:hypothetical protein
MLPVSLLWLEKPGQLLRAYHWGRRAMVGDLIYMTGFRVVLTFTSQTHTHIQVSLCEDEYSMSDNI